MSSRARQLADEHWNGYIKGLLESNGVAQELIDSAAYNYITAFQHGYKHAVEDIRHGEAERDKTPPLPDPVTHLDRNVKAIKEGA